MAERVLQHVYDDMVDAVYRATSCMPKWPRCCVHPKSGGSLRHKASIPSPIHQKNSRRS